MIDFVEHRNLRDLALEIAAITTLVDHLEEKKEQLRDKFQQVASTMGADSSKAMLDGKEIAKISLVSPKAKPRIIDDKAFVTFVKTFHPDEIVESVRDSFKKVWMDRIVAHEDGALDPETGEMFDFVEFIQGRPYISTRFQTTGREAVLEAFRRRHIPLMMEAPDEVQTKR